MISDKKHGVKIAESKAEAFWTRTKEQAEKDIEKSLYEIEIYKSILELAEKKIAIEKETFK